jgi:hypothetical protein
MQHYPKWIYHKELPAKIVHSKEDHDQHKDWKESPFEIKKPELKTEQPEEILKPIILEESDLVEQKKEKKKK